MSDASLPLQKAIVAALKADAAVKALVGAVTPRVFDEPNVGAEKPYISFGFSDVLTEMADEYEGSDASIQVDGWTAPPGKEAIKRLGRAIRSTLHDKALALDENQRLVSLTVEQIRYLVEPDSLTQHVAVTVRARTEPSA